MPSGCGDELERLRGADGKETCLFEDLELLSECGGGRVLWRVGEGRVEEVSVKGWNRWVSCVDRRVSCVDRRVSYVDRRVSCVDSSMGV